jgi:chloramphenicol-sensitive protein RarD
VGAYGLWGVLPIYWKLLQSVPSPQILAHRIVWSFLALLTLVVIRRELAPLRHSAQPRNLVLYAIASALLAANWLTYIWAVNDGRIVETSLGYFINPLVSVMLGVVFLGERLRRPQWLAVALAATGVSYLTWQHGALPWVSLVLAGTFGLYGLLKKQAPLGPLHGLTLETGLLWLPALLYLIAAPPDRLGQLAQADARTLLLLLLSGPITSLPLLLFSAAARSISLSSIGILQYLAPTCQLLIGIAIYHEPFDSARLVGFTLIWAALAVFSAEGIWRMRRQPGQQTL